MCLLLLILNPLRSLLLLAIDLFFVNIRPEWDRRSALTAYTGDMSSINQYTLLDSGNFRKLEQVGTVRVDRPAPQAAWRPRLAREQWHAADASFARFSGGTGKWTVHSKSVPETWTIDVPIDSSVDSPLRPADG